MRASGRPGFGFACTNVEHLRTLSENPTDAEIFRAQLFAEPLVPFGQTTTAENQALARALRAFAERLNPEDVLALTEFLEQFPDQGEPVKVGIALRPRQETTMTLTWIAQRLQMGTKTHLSHLLYWQGRDKKKNRKR